MTAVMNWAIVGPCDSDAELARASAAGDKRAFAVIYGRYADRLHDFCLGMLTDRDGAADCVQDVFCIAATRLVQLRDPDKLRPWLYSIARNEALRRINERRRETPSDELPDTAAGDPGPDMLAARTELADLIADAAGGLSDRDRSVLELAFRHGLNGPDLADALGVTPTNANTIVHRLRETIERSLGALLVSRRARTAGGCPELAAILDGWDGHFNVLMRKRISRHIESCDTCDEQRRRLVSPAALLGAAPVFIPAPAWLRDQTLHEVQLTCAVSQMSGVTDEADYTDGANAPRNQRSSLLPVTAFVVALLAALGLTFVWLDMQKTTIQTPIQVSEAAPPPPPAPPIPATPPPAPPIVEPVISATPAPPAWTPTVEPPAERSIPVAPPPISDAPPHPPPPPSPPPLSPPLPPPVLPPWPDWLPDWPAPPPPPPPGVEFRGPGDFVAPPIDPVPGSSVRP
jgi:RNA polymerase sigma factor (sigma-70 family)